MQPLNILVNWLQENTDETHSLFSLQDFHPLFPDLSDTAFKTLLSRAVRLGHLQRVCRGLYVYEKSTPQDGLLLFHAAAYLRSDEFNYISLESALSDAGVISQIPMNWISIVSSGRSNIISCGEFGHIEFVHSNQNPTTIMEQLTYDPICRLWRANIALAIRDMKKMHRNCDLINWDFVNDLI